MAGKNDEFIEKIVLTFETDNTLKKIAKEVENISVVKALSNDEKTQDRVINELKQRLEITREIKEVEAAIATTRFLADTRENRELYSELQQRLQQLQRQSLYTSIGDAEKAKAAREQEEKEKKSNKGIGSAFKKGFDSDDFKSIFKDVEKSFSGIGLSFVSVMGYAVSKVADFLEETFIDAVKNAWAELQEIATYDLSSSTTYNSAAYKLATSYGMTGAEAYAFQNAMEKTGTDLSTVWEALSVMPELRTAFLEYYETYLESYEENQELAESVQEFTKAWDDFKNDLMMEVMEWFSDNKAVILATLEAIESFLSGILTITGSIMDYLSIEEDSTDEERAAYTESIIESNIANNSVATSSSATTTNNYYNTYNMYDLNNTDGVVYETNIASLR